MKLTEIVNLLKEMVDGCPSLDGNDFLIAPSKVPNSVVDGYEIHMTGNFNDESRKYLNSIAIQNKLAIRIEPNSVMIYKARQLLPKAATS